MGFKVAVASSDGKVVNTHFGRASSFLIFDQKLDESFELLEKRDVTPICQEHEHLEDGLKDLLDTISDCQGVLVSRIGVEADLALRCQGQEAYIITDYIHTALQTLNEYRKNRADSER